jgi:hypothetical protein
VGGITSTAAFGEGAVIVALHFGQGPVTPAWRAGTFNLALQAEQIKVIRSSALVGMMRLVAGDDKFESPSDSCRPAASDSLHFVHGFSAEARTSC